MQRTRPASSSSNRQSRSARAIARRRHSLFESLERRAYLAVTASYSATSQQLTVIGDALDNTITLSRNAAGNILVNGGAVAITGGTPSVANTALMQIFGQAGNDRIELNESQGALPQANIFGGSGNDTLIGGSGADQLFGQSDNDVLLGKGGADFLFGGTENDTLTGGDGGDQVFGESGNDRMVWNPGDDTDLNEGGEGIDTTEVNGGGGAEQFTTTANGTRVRFDRLDPAPFSIDIGTTENLVLNMNGGNDSFSATGNLAALISITADGGLGNDTILGSNGIDLLLGGDGDDFIDGQQGNDVVFLGAGNDTFQWDPGDGSDVVEGQDGTDTMLFNGSAGAEIFEASANGQRVRFTRNLGNIVMDLNDLEQIELNTLASTDTTIVNDLSGTALVQININQAGTIGGTAGDAAADVVIVNGTNGNDIIDVFGSGTSVAVLGLTAQINISNSEGANDSLIINALGGADGITATTLPAAVIKLTLDGGAGNDSLLGSQGADVFLGGDNDDFIFGDNGNDLALMGAGNDVFQWDPGDGSDVVEGQGDIDTMLFFGSNASENINVLANGGRVLFLRDVGNVTMDLNDVESIDFRALGGADNIVVGDLSGTDMTNVTLDLRGPSGGGNGAADTVTVTGTNANDVFGATGDIGGVSTFGLHANVNLFFQEQANDKLILNALGGDDTVDATSLEADGIQLNINGGLGADILIGSKGNDLINGGDGNDLALMGAGDDTFVWNPGDDLDVIEGQAGNDTMLFNGANVAENIDISANAGRVAFFRNVATVTMDLNGVETVDFNAQGGADVIVVNDLSGTDLKNINLNLAAVGGGGDAQPDTVIVQGTSGDDVALVNGDATGTSVLGLAAQVNITGAEAANDRLTINPLAGDDVVDASGLAAGAIQLTADGGAGNDTLLGGAGGDVLAGGANDDVLFGGAGIDVLDGGDGENVVIQDGPNASSSSIVTVFGNSSSNSITISRDAGGNILSNGVAIPGATVANTALIRVFGLAGEDVITLNESNGALPAALLFGGAGVDTLTGGSGGDFVFGGHGNDALSGKGGFDFLLGGADNDTLTGGDADDFVFGEAGDDRMVWNPGDDTDLNEGGSGIDTVEVNGGGGAEVFTTTANGTRVRFDRLSPAPFAIDIGTSEDLVLNMNGGDDSFSATGNLAALIKLTIDGGAGNDTILGSNGVDLLLGGDNDDFIDGQQGNDVAFGGAGNDTFNWDPGDGSDTFEGQAGTDTLIFNGSNAAEIYDAAANGSRLRFTRNIGNIVMDVDGVENLSLNALGGADTVTINDLSATAVSHLDVNLAGTLGGTSGDALVDTVIINGTPSADAITVSLLNATDATVTGLPASINIQRPESALDVLVVRPLGGADSVIVNNGTNFAAMTIDIGGDTAADQVILNANVSGNNLNVVDVDNGTQVTGLSPNVTVLNAASQDSLRLNAGAGVDVITVNQSGTFGGVRTVQLDAGVDSDAITVANTAADGAVTILPSPGNDNVSVNTDGLFGANAVFSGTQRIGNLSVGPNGRASLEFGSDMVLTMAALNLTSTGRFDLADGNAIIDYTLSSPMATVRSKIASGFASGAWNGPGIVSSAAAAGSGTGTGIGYAEATDLFSAFPANFKGQSIDSTSILLSHTRNGDSNLDGLVNLDDFNRLAANFGQSGRSWVHGDSDYNGTVNLNDFNLLAANFGQSAAPPLPGVTSGSGDDDLLGMSK